MVADYQISHCFKICLCRHHRLPHDQNTKLSAAQLSMAKIFNKADPGGKHPLPFTPLKALLVL